MTGELTWINMPMGVQMKIVNLIEDTKGRDGCTYVHGLSFYVETVNHRILVDLGPSDETLKNAERLGVKLSQVDTVILSHGHYDHCGGVMAFSKINSNATIYMQESALREYYADDGEDNKDQRYRYIGIDKRIVALPQVKAISGECRIDDELELFTIKEKKYKEPFTNKRILVKENGEYIRDNFSHEQYLVIRDGGKCVLMSGCAHNGILNILNAYNEKYSAFPDAVISGFHLMKKAGYTEEERSIVEDIGNELKNYPTIFYTCHCTGEPAYEIMKRAMGDKLHYVHSGEEIDLK